MGLMDFLKGRPSPARFARIMVRAMRRAGSTEPIEYDPDGFRLVIGRPASDSFYLSNAYAEFCAAPRWSRRSKILTPFVRSLGSSPDTIPDRFVDARPRLLPRVRERCYYEETRLRILLDGETEFEVPTQTIAGHLAVEVVHDSPDSVSTITQVQLTRWGMTFEDALAVARENLWKISNEPFRETSPGVFESVWSDFHAASRLFLHDLIWQLPVTGAHVAMIPHRDVLLVTGAENVDGLSAMCARAEAVLQQPRAMSGIPVILRDGRWDTLTPEPTHLPLWNLRVTAISDEYARQKALLEALHAKRKEDIFVATASLCEDKRSGRRNTFAAWTCGVDTLLPRTDRISFVAEDQHGEQKMIGVADWDRVAGVVGSLMEPQSTYPERFRVREFPTQDQLTAIGLSEPE